jgi:ligand-binding sensor domain-containing protein
MLKWMIITALIFMSCFCHAQEINTLFHHLSVENGLSDASNSHIYKDSRGFVWIGSKSGLNRFDGRQVRVYQPGTADTSSLYGQNILSSFFEENNGDLWFSTYEGVNCYVRSRDCFEHYTVVDSTIQKNYSSYYVAGKDADNRLWVLVNGVDVYIFDIKTKQFNKKHSVIASSQRFQVQTNAQNQVIRSFANTWSKGNYGLYVTEYLKNGSIRQSILFDKVSSTPLSIFDLYCEENNIWINSQVGLLRYNFDNKTLQPLYTRDNVNSSVPLNEKSLIISTLRNGILIINKLDGTIEREFRHSDINPHSLVTDETTWTKIDNDKNIWVLFGSVGVDYTNLAKSKFKNIYTYFNSATHLKERFTARALTIDNEQNLWSGSYLQNIKLFTKNGILKDSFTINTRSARSLSNNTALQSFIDTKKRIWFLHFKTLQYFDVATQTFKQINRNDFFLYGIVTKSGKIIIASFSGIYELVETGKDKFEFKALTHILSDKPHSIIFEDNDTWLWSSYDATAIRVYDNKGIIKEIPINGSITGFWHQPNTSIVWVCSQNGLYKIDKNTWQYSNFTEKEGLPSRTINTMQADANNNLWMGTSKGMAKFETATGKVYAYNLVDGISDLNFNMYASTQAPDGTMYFGTSNGITTFHPKNVTPLSIQALPTITNILINDEEPKDLICTTTGATSIPELQHLHLPYSQNTISFTFSAMEYSDPMNCKFQYKMEGVDKDWVQTGTQNFARYASLPAGTYRFLLKASNSDGIWNETPRVLEINIIPPFYKTWWFILLSSITLLSLVGYIVYLRLSKIIELQGIRLKLYENLHDDIGSRLTAIVIMVEQILHTSKQKDPTLPKISDISKSIVGNMRRLVWATAPENDALKNIVDKMREDRRVLLPEAIAFSVETDTSLYALPIAGDKRYQMLSVFNEALTNINKYAAATKVTVALSVAADNLTMVIQDNGKGFDMHAPRTEKENSSGYGLQNMQKRANRIKGNLKITSELGVGTTITFTFPLKDDNFLHRFKEYFSKYHQNW